MSGIRNLLIMICLLFGGGVYILELYLDNLEGLIV